MTQNSHFTRNSIQNPNNDTSRNTFPAAGETILADGISFAFNDYKAGLNDNILVVGGSGTGKTRTIVSPNLLQAEGNYIVSDPKGNLYDLYGSYLKEHGYRVECLNFARPDKSTIKYNLFHYIHNEIDILKVANILCSVATSVKDPFWDYMSQILIESLIGYLIEARSEKEQSLPCLIDLLQRAQRTDNDRHDSDLDFLLSDYMDEHKNSLTAKFYRSVSANPSKTWNCIVTTTLSKIAAYNAKELRSLLSRDTLHLEQFRTEKIALFIVVSDTDRSMDDLVSIFYTQLMQELCRIAEMEKNSRLSIPVRFILDDFATNVRIDQFPRMISSIRSRGISTMLLIQAESQLTQGYQDDADTIISNCDTYVYLGGNDIKTARNVGERCDCPMLEILNMPIGTCWIFRRGSAARNARTFDLETFEKAKRAETSKSSVCTLKRADPDTEKYHPYTPGFDSYLHAPHQREITMEELRKILESAS